MGLLAQGQQSCAEDAQASRLNGLWLWLKDHESKDVIKQSHVDEAKALGLRGFHKRGALAFCVCILS